MPDDRREDRAYERAHKRVEDLRGFYVHLVVYASSTWACSSSTG